MKDWETLVKCPGWALLVEFCTRTYEGNFLKWMKNPALNSGDISIEYLRGESGFAHRVVTLPEEMIEGLRAEIEDAERKGEDDE